MNAVECEPVENRVLNPTASEASYKPKKRSIQKNKSKKKVLAPDSPCAEMSGTEMSGAEMSGDEMSSAKTAPPNRRRRNVPDPTFIWSTFILLSFFSRELQRASDVTEKKE